MRVSSAILVLALFSGLAGAQSVKSPSEAKDMTLGNPRVGSDRIMTSAFSLTFVTHVPGDTNRLFVVEKRGRIMILNLNTLVVNGTAFLDIDPVVATGSEWGLLGLAFHPNYASNGLFYVNYTRDSDKFSVIAEYAVSGNPDIADGGSERVLLALPDVNSNHNAGWLGFSPLDGYLYVTTGDGGNGCDTGGGHTAGTGNAQDTSANLYGKILRIDPLAALPYGIPSSNPFFGVTAGDDEIWCYGLRNPYRASFDSATGDLYIGDVGQDKREEVDYQPAASLGGENYGWRCREGLICSAGGASNCPATTGCLCPAADAGMKAPIHDYSHQTPPAPASSVCSVIGGYVYRGRDLPRLRGHYFFADYCGDTVWGFTVHNGAKLNYSSWTPHLRPSIDGFNWTDIQSFGEDANGELYLVASAGVYKIVPRP